MNANPTHFPYFDEPGLQHAEDRDMILRELAAEYHDRCDMFDNGIAPNGDPRRPKERRAMILHSIAVREEIEKRIPSYERLTFRYYTNNRETA